MKIVFKKSILAMILLMFFSGTFISQADISEEARKKKNKKDEIQRTYKRYFDLQENSISDIQLPITNYGIIGLDVANSTGGGYWPRGSQNQYIFGGGIWFGAVRENPNTSEEKKYVEVTYNPNSGESWMVPGHIKYDEQDVADQSDINRYRTYFSTDFRPDGKTIDPDEGGDWDWPIWDVAEDPEVELKYNRYFGAFVGEKALRTSNKYERGPAFISGEDIFCTYKDTDLNQYEGGYGRRSQEGYPLRLQFEQMIYSWGFGDYANFMFVKYTIINYSQDTLKDCWVAPVMDVDIARRQNARFGAGNDRARYYEEADSLNLAFQWSESDRGEAGRGFGYLGFDFLESPAVIRTFDTVVTSDGDTVIKEIQTDSTGFIRKDSSFYATSSQLGLVTFRNWAIENDILEDEPRYEFMASAQKDGDIGAGDKRFMMATGPFHMRPGDTARVVVGIILANAAVRQEPDGSKEDVKNLVDRDIFAQRVYDENFRAPTPPFKTKIQGYKPLNNGIQIMWDSTAEASFDTYEKGLDFMGYKIFRAKDPTLDTFNVDQISPGQGLTKGAGPFGWKEIRDWRLPNPFRKSVHRAGEDPNNEYMPYIDSLKIVGFVEDDTYERQYDPFKLQVIRVGRGVNLLSDSLAQEVNPGQTVHPIITSLTRNLQSKEGNLIPYFIEAVDTSLFSQPWGPYYAQFVGRDDALFTHPSRKTNNYLLDSVMLGEIHLNPSLLNYNPIFFKKITVEDVDTSYIFSTIFDTSNVWGEGIVAHKEGTGSKTFTVVDTVFFKESLSKGDQSGEFYIDVMVKRNLNNIMSDREHVQASLDSIYKYIQEGMVTEVEFPEFESKPEIIQDVIIPYMREATNDFTYTDFGDDNRNGVIETNLDPSKTEKILNNIDYYYKIVAYDEGDYVQPTPTKFNIANDGTRNFIETHAKSSPAGKKAAFDILPYDTARMGGLYNFEFFAFDQQRINQLYAGDTLELEFEPYFNLNQITFPGNENPTEFSMYYRRMILRNISTDEVLFDGVTNFEVSPCQWFYRGGFTENAASYVFTDDPVIDTVAGDTNYFGTTYGTGAISRSGYFTTGEFEDEGHCYTRSFAQDAFAQLGFSFDFTMKQYGGRYRPDSTTQKINGDAITPVDFVDRYQEWNHVFTTQVVDTVYLDKMTLTPLRRISGSFNNGPAWMEVEFKPGGTEEMTLNWGSGNEETFQVEYLEVDVKNVITMNRPVEPNSEDSIEIQYPQESWHHVVLDTTHRTQFSNTWYPNPYSLGMNYDTLIGGYNLRSHAFVNGRGDNSAFTLNKQVGKQQGNYENTVAPIVGTQGRYYLSAASGGNTVDFVNVLTVNGVQFAFDFANKARFWGQSDNMWSDDAFTVPEDEYDYSEDFEPGDQVLLKTKGGVLGLPMPGAKIRCRVTESEPAMSEYTDNLLDQIQVVPNPYYISHIGEQSPYDTQLYFTKLPKKCTIDIYTIMGDLIKTIEHDEINSYDENKVAVEVWDLLSKNRQRVESQTMVAVITTPNGAQTVKKFSVVVGGFRLIETDE